MSNNLARTLALLLYLTIAPATAPKIAPVLFAQSAPLPVDDENYDLVRRLLVRYGTEGFAAPATDLSLRPNGRAQLTRLVKTYWERRQEDLSRVDRYRMQQFFNDNNEWLALPVFGGEDNDRAVFDLGNDFAALSPNSPLYQKRSPILGFFYPTPSYLVEINKPDFYLRLNPIVDLRYGRMRGTDEPYFFNRRGVRLRAGVDERIFVHFDLLETQLSLPNYVRGFRERFGSLPGAGFLKRYELELLGVRRGQDFLNGQGYMSADITRHVGARLGYGTHFIGDGERSVILSDFSNNYPYLELNWRVWKLHYRNIFAELTGVAQGISPPGVPLEKKYLAAHHLSMNVTDRLTVGLFEAVVFNRQNGFDLAYLNPVIFYRTIEQSLGSPDNALIGLTARYRSPWRVEAYGQFILDEFKFDELFTLRRGWWGNKWAYQIGARYVDAFGLDQLDLVAERNVARPYAFTHRAGAAYTHFAMPLAHPLGANFTENLVGIDYRPLPRLHLRARLYLIQQGRGDADNVVGENLTFSNLDRNADFGNEISQGDRYDVGLLTLRAGYELVPNLWVESEFLRRNQTDEAEGLETTVVNLGVRWNVARREFAF